MTKKILTHTAKFTLVVFVLIAFYFLLAFCLSHITVNSNTPKQNDVTLYVMSNGIHTDIVVPTKNGLKDWSTEIKFSNTIGADSSYKFLAIGWGDKQFYLETPEFSDLKLATALGAISGTNSSAMHTTYYQTIAEDKYCKKLFVSEQQYAKLVEYISKSFEKDTDGHVIKVNSSIHYDKGDAFYDAVGSYSIFKTCNTWTNSALKACEQKACLWTIFDGPILSKYE